MDRSTGRSTEGLAHLRQSVEDILTTPLGSRPMRRDYGSRLMELTDRPINEAARMEFFAATVEALDRWEPRLKVKQVGLVAADEPGRVSISVRAEYLPDGREVKMDGIVV